MTLYLVVAQVSDLAVDDIHAILSHVLLHPAVAVLVGIGDMTSEITVVRDLPPS